MPTPPYEEAKGPLSLTVASDLSTDQVEDPSIINLMPTPPYEEAKGPLSLMAASDTPSDQFQASESASYPDSLNSANLPWTRVGNRSGRVGFPPWTDPTEAISVLEIFQTDPGILRSGLSQA